MPLSIENPPALVQHRPLPYEMGTLPAMLKLRHHFLLTRLKLSISHMIDKDPTKYMTAGFANDVQNLLISHGYCTIIGCRLPTPYFLQELLLSPYTEADRRGGTRSSSFTKVVIAAEVSDRDQSFYNRVTAGFREWWNSEDETAAYPGMDEICSMLDDYINKLSDKGLTWDSDLVRMCDLDHILAAMEDTEAGTESASPNLPSAAGSGGFAEPSAAATPIQPLPLDQEHLYVLAKELDLVGPNLPELSAQDIGDLTVLDHLTQTSARMEQLLAAQAELTERVAWNYEAALQLGTLTTRLGDIPFKPLPEPAATSKGKERARPKKLSILGINSEDAEEAWDNHRNPFPKRKIPPHAKTFEQVLPTLYPDLFGEEALHHCGYRDHLFNLMKSKVQERTTENLASRLSDPNPGTEFNFYGHRPQGSSATLATALCIEDRIEAAAFPNSGGFPSSSGGLSSSPAAVPNSTADPVSTPHNPTDSKSEGSDSSGWESDSPREDDGQSRIVQDVAIEGAAFFNSNKF